MSKLILYANDMVIAVRPMTLPLFLGRHGPLLSKVSSVGTLSIVDCIDAAVEKRP